MKTHPIVLALCLSFALALSTAATGCKTTRGTRPAEEAGAAAGAQPSLPAVATEVSAEGEPVSGDWLVRNLGSNPPTLNPILSNDTSSGAVLAFLFESLVERDLKTLDYKPLLAESWTVGEDQRTFTFRIRQGVKFHDGTPMTIEDVVFSYERMLDPEVDAAEKRSYFSQLEHIRQTGPDTIECKYKEVYFLALAICGSVEIIPRHYYGGAKGKAFNTQPANEKPVGTGPLRFVEWKRGETLTLARFDGYWGPKDQQLNVERMLFRFIVDPEAEFINFTKGDQDTLAVRPEKWFREAAEPGFASKFHRLEFDFPAYFYIGWNMRKPQFADANTRVALHHLIDRDLIARQIYRGLARPINSIEFDKSPYWNPHLATRTYDPQKAAALLAQAGWTDSDGDGILDRDGQRLEFTLLIVQGNPEGEQLATNFQDTLKRAGIRLNIAMLDWANLLKKLDKRDFDAAMLGWALSVDPDPYQLWHSSQAGIEGSSNYPGFRNPRVDELIEMNRRELDRDRRIPILQEIQKIIYDEAPYLFLFSRRSTLAVSNRFRNIRFYTPRPCIDYREWFVPRQLQKYTPVSP
ncbi:MAG: peptide-binding protein [Deltaproteobacteria bacterium]|nr:peptide-binding protein [Deltaproteobacteria bacterium]